MSAVGMSVFGVKGHYSRTAECPLQWCRGREDLLLLLFGGDTGQGER